MIPCGLVPNLTEEVFSSPAAPHSIPQGYRVLQQEGKEESCHRVQLCCCCIEFRPGFPPVVCSVSGNTSSGLEIFEYYYSVYLK